MNSLRSIVLINGLKQLNCRQLWYGLELLTELANADRRKINIIRFFIRSLIVLDRKSQYGLALVGPAASGKSLFATLLKEMIGGFDTLKSTDVRKQSVSEISIHRISNKFELSRLMDVRLLVFPDFSSSEISPTQSHQMKVMFSGEQMTMEVKYGPVSLLTPMFKVLLDSNHPIRLRDSDSGFDRRVLVVECIKSVAKVDPDLFEKLQKNIEGLINWALYTPKEIHNFKNFVPLINAKLCHNGGNPMLDSVLSHLEPASKKESLKEKESLKVGALDPATGNKYFLSS
jgi:phage/plasmid-associated DNA primase